MKTQVIEGTPQQIVERITRLGSALVRAVVYTEEPATSAPTPSSEDMFSEMDPYTVAVGHADDSRASIYTRREGE